MKKIITIPSYFTSGSRKSWYKHVTAVDSSKTNGYAFDGDFVKDEVMLEFGSIIIEKRPHGSVKNGYWSWVIYEVAEKITPNTIEIDSWDEVTSIENLNLLHVFPSEKFLSFREKVSELLSSEEKSEKSNPLSEFSIEELEAELERRRNEN